MSLISGTIKVNLAPFEAESEVILPPELWYVLRGLVDESTPTYEIVQRRDGTRSLILSTQPAKKAKEK